MIDSPSRGNAYLPVNYEGDAWATADCARMSWNEITTWMAAQRDGEASWLQNMLDVRDAYNGDTIVSLPDVDKEPSMSAPIPALVSDTVDNLAMRSNSTRPVIGIPALGGVDNAVERARKTRRALYGRWHDSALADVQLRRAYRHWYAYGTSVIWVMPDFVKKCARIEVRNPLGVYADYRYPDDIEPPRRIGSVFGRSTEWLRKRYPETMSFEGVKKARATDLWDVIEYVDDERIVLGIVGPRHRAAWGSEQRFWPLGGIELRRWQNRAGMVPVAMPTRVTLDRIAGQVANVVGIVNLMAKMTALDVISAEKAVFGDMVILGDQGKEPILVNGAWRDGRTGEPNFLRDAKAVETVNSSPGPLTQTVIDRLERAARITGGNPAMMGGELNGSIRSGQTVSALGGLSIDPRIQEGQEVMARGLVVVNKALVAVEQGNFPRRKMFSFTGWANDEEITEYVPSDLIADHNTVTYAMPGADANHITVAVSQAVGAELMSRHSARIAHPWIQDPEGEERHIVQERMRDAVLNSFVQQAASGAIPLIDMGRIMQLFDQGEDLVHAISKAHDEAQKRQAAEPQPTEPGQGLPPETQPGLAQPGQGVETAAGAANAQSPIPPPAEHLPGGANLKALAAILRAKAGYSGEPGVTPS